VQGIEETNQSAELSRPLGPELIVQAALNQLRVAHPREAVIGTLEVGAPLLGQLPGCPLAPVQADLYVEGEPGLNAGIAEAEARVQVVVIKVFAFSVRQSQTPLVLVLRLVIFERPAGLDRLEDTDQALVDRIFLQDAPGEIFFIRPSRLQILHRPTQFLCLGQ
jgi:hypothetical protein